VFGWEVIYAFFFNKKHVFIAFEYIYDLYLKYIVPFKKKIHHPFKQNTLLIWNSKTGEEKIKDSNVTKEQPQGPWNIKQGALDLGWAQIQPKKRAITHLHRCCCSGQVSFIATSSNST
jgi:hypothetical protein